MTRISDLPRDLVEEIMSRIPVKNTRAVRLSCKKWDTLWNNRRWIGKEAVREGECRMLVWREYSLYLTSIDLNGNGNPCAETKGKLINLLDPDQPLKISRVWYCEGVLACMLEGDYTRLVVLNPYCDQTRVIHFRYCYPSPHYYQYNYSLGYGKKKSYKILRFLDDYHPMLWYEIYDFYSDLWTTLDVHSTWRIEPTHRGLSLKGNTYFGATTKASGQRFMVDSIICFDFTRLTFAPLLPLPFKSREAYLGLSCLREEKLAALLYHDLGVDLWITTQIEPHHMSWTKFLTIPFPLGPRFRLCLFEDVALLFRKAPEAPHFMHFSAVDISGAAPVPVLGDVKQVLFGEPASPWFGPRVFSYSPSSVQIKLPARRKRKRQSFQETCRYDQNVSRLEQHRRTTIRFKLYQDD